MNLYDNCTGTYWADNGAKCCFAPRGYYIMRDCLGVTKYGLKIHPQLHPCLNGTFQDSLWHNKKECKRCVDHCGLLPTSTYVTYEVRKCSKHSKPECQCLKGYRPTVENNSTVCQFIKPTGTKPEVWIGSIIGIGLLLFLSLCIIMYCCKVKQKLIHDVEQQVNVGDQNVQSYNVLNHKHGGINKFMENFRHLSHIDQDMCSIHLEDRIVQNLEICPMKLGRKLLLLSFLSDGVTEVCLSERIDTILSDSEYRYPRDLEERHRFLLHKCRALCSSIDIFVECILVSILSSYPRCLQALLDVKPNT